jgi:hypothetical protein
VTVILPIVLLALHKHLDSRSTRWLLLLAAAWILQSLANGHYLLFGMALIGMWLLYFCTTRTHLRPARRSRLSGSARACCSLRCR